jgi:hypothetical protein
MWVPLQCTPCLWLKAYTATQPCLSMVVSLSYLAESSGASRFIHSKGVHGVSLSTVSVVFDRI